MKRKRYTKEFKAKVVLAAVKSQKTVNEIAAEFGVHVNQINDCKCQLLAGLPEVFDRKGERREAANEREKNRLYRQIGKRQVEMDWLKKRLDISDEHTRETGVYRRWTSAAEYRSPVRA